MSKSSTLRVQQWGNSLAIRVPAALAREARLTLGQPVRLALKEGAIVVQAVGEPELTLAQRLARFDANVHGGEMMADAPRGAEFGAAEQRDVAVGGPLSTDGTATGTAGPASDPTEATHERAPVGGVQCSDVPRGGADLARRRDCTR